MFFIFALSHPFFFMRVGTKTPKTAITPGSRALPMPSKLNAAPSSAVNCWDLTKKRRLRLSLKPVPLNITKNAPAPTWWLWRRRSWKNIWKKIPDKLTTAWRACVPDRVLPAPMPYSCPNVPVQGRSPRFCPFAAGLQEHIKCTGGPCCGSVPD